MDPVQSLDFSFFSPFSPFSRFSLFSPFSRACRRSNGGMDDAAIGLPHLGQNTALLDSSSPHLGQYGVQNSPFLIFLSLEYKAIVYGHFWIDFDYRLFFLYEMNLQYWQILLSLCLRNVVDDRGYN